jgi:hypothetical protein
MSKIHFTNRYTYPNDGNIKAVSVCGLRSSSNNNNFINCTILEDRINCKNCLRIINKHNIKKTLVLPLKRQWFEMTKTGIKNEEYRELTDYWIKRLVDTVTFFGGRYDAMKNISVKEAGIENINLLHLKPDVLKKDVKFKSFDYNLMLLGYPKLTDTERVIKLEHKGIEIRTGNPEWGAEPEKLYFVIKHGQIIK